MRSTATALAIAVLASSAGCLSPPMLPPRRDAGARDVGDDAWTPPFAVLGIDVVDASGRDWASSDAPRTPTITVRFNAAPSDTSLVLLLDGRRDADLTTRLGTRPLRAAIVAREEDVMRTLAGSTISLTPRVPLLAGNTYTLAVARWESDVDGNELDVAFTQELTISRRAEAGAIATDAWPPDVAFDVAPALALAAIRFDGTVADATTAISLRDAAGSEVTATRTTMDCAMIGWTGGTCVALVPSVRLASMAMYTLAVRSTARDTTGATIPPFAAQFTTASSPASLAWMTTTCALGEAAHRTTHGCTRVDDESVHFRAQLSAGARVLWTFGAASGGVVAARGIVEIDVPHLPALTPGHLVLDVVDYAGTHLHASLVLTTTDALPTLSITEVRAYPYGTRPRQEYVEVWNYGMAAVSLSGFAISTSATSAGDLLPDVTIPAGARALVVAAGFDPNDTSSGDVAVPAATILAHVNASIGSAGLSTLGTPVFLRDASNADQWISAAPATPPPQQGVCTVRVAASHRTGEPGSFGYDPAQTCTPGR